MSLEYERLVEERTADINLQVAVSNHEDTATLYGGPNKCQARRWAVSVIFEGQAQGVQRTVELS